MSVGGFVVHGKTFGRILSITGDKVQLYPTNDSVNISQITYVKEKDSTPYIIFHFYTTYDMKTLDPLIQLYLNPYKLTEDQILKKSKLHYLLKGIDKSIDLSKPCKEEGMEQFRQWILNKKSPLGPPNDMHTMDHTFVGRNLEDMKRLCSLLVKRQCNELTPLEDKIICILNGEACDLDEFSDVQDDSSDVQDSGLLMTSDQRHYITHVMSFANAL